MQLEFVPARECDIERIYASNNGIISFGIPEVDSNKIAEILANRNICVRGGLHCAPLTHMKLGTKRYGLVRVSLSVFNSEDDAYYLSKALKEIFI